MTKLVNRAKMTTASTGTGSPITLGSAVDGYQTFADAGVADGDVVRYVIEDGTAWEIGLGTYTASGTTLTRGSIESSNADNALNLTGNAVVYVSAAAADLQELVDFADNFVLPTADGSTGQVLQTNGAGTLSFTTISGYTDADVDTHLNTGTASSGEVLSWTGSDYDWITAGGAFTADGSNNLYAISTLANLTTGTDNFAAGQNAGNALTSSIGSVAIGPEAGKSANSDAVIAIGQNSATLATGQDTTAVGRYSAAAVTTGTGSTAFGALTLRNATGSGNTAVGKWAGRYIGSGPNNTAVGNQALYGSSVSKLTGEGNVGIGLETGYDLSTGGYNFLGGYLAGTNLTTGSNNVAIGNGALDAATTGGRNIAIGQDAMGLGVATAASGDNVAIGYQAGYDLTSGTDNVFIGASAASNHTSASGNISIGNGSMLNWTGGSSNTVIGDLAAGLGSNSTGETNTIVGAAAGYDLANGSENTFVGQGSGFNVTSGGQNVHIGRISGNTTTTGSNTICVGYDAEASSATVSNEITLGNSSITRFRIPGAGIDNTSAALSGTTPSVDVGARDTYTLTTSGNTTFTFTGVPSSGQVGTFSLIITAGGTHTLTWPASVDWAGGTAPDAPASGETDIYTFMTVNGGTTWYGFLAGDAMA